MPDREPEVTIRQAAHELQRYLSDEIAPMMAVEYFEEFLPQSPETTARVIAHWVQTQHRSPTENVGNADLVFHAMKKLSLLSELELVRRGTVMRHIHDVSRILIQACPAHERDTLRIRLSQLGESETVLSARAEFLHRRAEDAPPAGAAAPAKEKDAAGEKEKPPDPKTIDKGAQALSLLLTGLAKLKKESNDEKDKDGPEAALLAQILATAALESKSNDELAQHLERIKKEGVATPMGQVFRALGWSLPGWGEVGAGDAKEKGKPIPLGRHLEAMNRIVALAPDAQERAKRWGEMIYAAIEQFNGGRLAQAVSILEVAKNLINEKRPDATIVGQVLSQAEEAIATDVLRRLVEVPAKHGLIRKVLDFFPSFRADALLRDLDGEIRRERRKLMLALIECHGSGCRNLVLDKLAAVMRHEIPDAEGFFRRNLAFLLRRIPRTGHDRLEEEMDLVAAMIARDQPPISAKEAIGALGQLRQPAAERALVDRLYELESELIARGGNQEGWELLDRLCAALVRHGTSRAIRAVAGHAYNRSPALGDALSRFEHLSWLDLSVDPEQLAALMKAIRELVPSKMLGFVVKRGSHELSCLLQAVSGTPTQEVRTTLEGIAAKFARRPLGEQATKALAKLEPRARPGASAEALGGDLELFGLPSLLQSLAGAQSAGELILFDRQQGRQGSLTIAGGRIVRCEAGRLTGAEAAYLLMEKPFPGTFTFRATADDRRAPAAGSLDPMNVILEGARRHDEYQQARAFAPDRVRYEPSGSAAMRPEDETDGEFASSVWDRAAAGMTAETCELEMQVDPYRVRRLYAYWVEARALRPRVEAVA